MLGSNRNPFTREDTLLGVCQAIADDFGFDPIYLRLTLSVSLIWNPAAVVAMYFALGAGVLASRIIARLVVRSPRKSRSVGGEQILSARASIAADNREYCEDLAVAA